MPRLRPLSQEIAEATQRAIPGATAKECQDAAWRFEKARDQMRRLARCFQAIPDKPGPPSYFQDKILRQAIQEFSEVARFVLEATAAKKRRTKHKTS